MGCTNVEGRVKALQKETAAPEFGNHQDIPNGGALLSLPALLSNGLISHNGLLDLSQGYYSLPSIQLTLAFAFLLRLKSVEGISKEPPGEFGKLIGLDRIPEVKTIRNKLAELSKNQKGEIWLGALSKDWMQGNPELAGTLYIDGHEMVYSGQQKLPKRFISRLRLAMRGSTDYWVCDKIGQPFFSVNTTANSSMMDVIKEKIIPRLEEDVPGQPMLPELKQDPFLHRFMIVYDRECYSNDFILDNWDKRIACCTYNKYVKDKWPEKEFREYEIETEDGGTEKIMLAERGVLIQGKESEKLPARQPLISFMQTDEGPIVKITKKRTKKKRQQMIREIRKLRKNGIQTSILTTNYKLSITMVGLYMFARWCQENFFKYMIENYGLDMIVSYITQKMSDTQELINPQWRKQDKQVRSKRTKLQHKQASYGELTYQEQIKNQTDNDPEFEKYKAKKAELAEEISIQINALEKAKKQRDAIEKYVKFSDLPDEHKFEAVYNERKQLLDIIKIIAYRAETSLVNTIGKHMNKPEQARAKLSQIFKSSIDMEVDRKNNILKIKIHNQPRHMDDKILVGLCSQLNETETVFPETNYIIKYSLINH